MIARTQPPHQAPAKSRLKMAALAPAAHIGIGARSVFVHDGAQFVGDFAHGLLPRYFFKSAWRVLERRGEPVGVVLVVGDVHALAADVTLAAGVGLVWADPGDFVVFDEDVQSAVLGA